MHNPNPFDFVPLQPAPLLYEPKELDGLGTKLTGYIDLKIKALTPVHIVGSLERGPNSSNSRMFQQDRIYCIPASTIRGCLRSFVEALTSGWVSQATPDYSNKYGKRHIGFSTFDEYINTGLTAKRKSPPAILPEFNPQNERGGRIDLASYLFGMVIEPEKGNESAESIARKGKVWIEDVLIDNSHVVAQKYWLPDIEGTAFMGGAHPSASNWWYFAPDEIWNRKLKDRNGNPLKDRDGNPFEVAEFVGSHFWGRKFYYHQQPLPCIRHYDPGSREWRYSHKAPFHRVNLSCMEQDRSTATFRIYVNQLPQQLVGLLMLVLLPGSMIRHKIGYGKAYGYGSIEFELKGMHLRRESDTARLPAALGSFDFGVDGWDQATLDKFGLTRFIDQTALRHLAQILGWDNSDTLLFTYPPFGKPVLHSDLKRLAPRHIPVTNSMKVSPEEAKQIAAALFRTKRSIHFRYYQEQAKGWDTIVKRKP